VQLNNLRFFENQLCFATVNKNIKITLFNLGIRVQITEKMIEKI